jgi:hypothetical protein
VAKTGPKKPDKEEVPGTLLSHFEAGVRALVELRDRGLYLLFLGSLRRMKLVGEGSVFRTEFLKHLGEKGDASDPEEVLEEIREYITILLFAGGDSERTATIIFRQREDEFKGKNEAKEAFRGKVKDKITFLQKHIALAALQSRYVRLGNLASACLEDVEYDLVGERAVPGLPTPYTDAFLRVRLRFTQAAKLTPPFRDAFFFEDFVGPRLESFELECDEYDIDFLISRLTVAKRRLLQAREQSTVNNNG